MKGFVRVFARALLLAGFIAVLVSLIWGAFTNWQPSYAPALFESGAVLLLGGGALWSVDQGIW